MDRRGENPAGQMGKARIRPVQPASECDQAMAPIAKDQAMSLWGRFVMAIKIAADIHRLTRAGVLSLAGIFTLCATAVGQAPLVSMGSVVPIPINSSMNQIYKMVFYKGNVLALDSGADTLYQLPPGGTIWNDISGPGRNSNFLGGGYNAASMAIDAMGTIYITDGVPPGDAGTALFWRFPVTCTNPTTASKTCTDPNSAQNSYTWSLSTAGAWGGNIIDPNNAPTAIVAEAGQGTQDVQFENSPAMDGSGTLYFVTTGSQIMSVPVDKLGNSDLATITATSIVNTVAQGGNMHMAIDAVGNIYFVAGHAINATNGVRPAGTTGIYFIPAGTTGIKGSNGSAEAQLQRVDNLQESSTSPVVYAGVTLDAAGNLYMTSEVNSGYGETFAGIWELPNVCGKPPTAATLNTCMDDGDVALLAPISSNQPLAIDSRGYFWIPTYQQYSPSGEGAQTGVYSIAVFAPGVLNLNYPIAGASPTGTAGPAGNLYVSFNGTYQPSAFQFSSATGSASQFGLTLTNPLPNPSATTPTVPCNSTAGNAGGAYNTYLLTNSCLLWVTLDPTVPGPVSGELTMYSTGNPSYTVYVSGTGQGAGVAMLNSPTLTTLAAPAALNTPGQVATDLIGDTWVADAGAKQVIYFPAGSSSASGKSIGTGLSDPTGVAVDGTGDIYIADWNSSKKTGTVYEIPWVPNTSKAGGAYGTQTVVATGLGDNLNLAADTTGDVYVADPQNARVVKIPTPAQASLVVNPETAGDTSSKATVTIGSGFTAPSAVAVDSTGDVFVADGTSLYEISAFPYNAQTTITNSLPAAVNNLTVDAAGSLIAALNGEGLYRIPNFVTNGVGALSVNSASLIDTSFTLPGSASCGGPGACTNTTDVTSPEGVALDQRGNIYVTDMTNGTPNLYEMNVVNGFVNYGVGLTPQVAQEQDLDLFNIGNEALNLTGSASPVAFSGPDLADYSLTAPSGGTECDTTGVKSVATGASCSLGPTFTPPALASTDLTPNIYSGDSLSIPTNASNIGGGGKATAALQAASINNLETTQTSVVVNLTSSTYPGSGSITVNIAPATNSTYTYSLPDAPTGTVVLTLSCASPGCTQASIVETGTATFTGTGQNTSVTFSNLQALDGGNYNVSAEYQGSVLNLMAKSSGTATFTVNTATPVISLSQPVGVTPNTTNGVIYLQQGVPNTLVANVSSTVGSPTGTVTLVDSIQGSLGAATYTSNQNWTFSTGSLASASYSVIASYAGDQNFSPVSTTVRVAFQVIPPSALLTASPTTVTTAAGTPVASTITIQSLVGFSALAGANIICEIAPTDTVPSYSECTFTNPQPIICAPTTTGNTCTPTSTVLTLSTNIPVNIPTSARNVPTQQSHASPFALAGIFGLGLLGLALRRRAIFNRYLLNLVCLMLFFAGTVMGIASCTNSDYTKTPKVPVYTTPSGTYNMSIQITNTSTGLVESLPFTMKVTIQ
jgi:Bacterial Ig-like domain (group 3)